MEIGEGEIGVEEWRQSKGVEEWRDGRGDRRRGMEGGG